MYWNVFWEPHFRFQILLKIFSNSGLTLQLVTTWWIVPLWKFLYGVIRNPLLAVRLECLWFPVLCEDLRVWTTSWPLLDQVCAVYESRAMKITNHSLLLENELRCSHLPASSSCIWQVLGERELHLREAIDIFHTECWVAAFCSLHLFPLTLRYGSEAPWQLPHVPIELKVSSKELCMSLKSGSLARRREKKNNKKKLWKKPHISHRAGRLVVPPTWPTRPCLVAFAFTLLCTRKILSHKTSHAHFCWNAIFSGKLMYWLIWLKLGIVKTDYLMALLLSLSLCGERGPSELQLCVLRWGEGFIWLFSSKDVWTVSRAAPS